MAPGHAPTSGRVRNPPGHRMLFPEVDLGCGVAAVFCSHWGVFRVKPSGSSSRCSPGPQPGELLLPEAATSPSPGQSLRDAGQED